jgi:tetratricopeptide (TPR) repeat protein
MFVIMVASSKPPCSGLCYRAFLAMERVEKTVFLSYRRTNFPWALAIYQNLTHHGFDVFFDFNGIGSGDFERVILENITSRAHFLVLLTPSALERCNEPHDWLRREIETALDSQRNTVPLMLEGFDFGTPKIAEQLTGKLAALRRYNGLFIPPALEYFKAAMDRLRQRFLNVPLSAVLHPASRAANEAVTEQKAAAAAAPAVSEQELTAQHWFERGFAAKDPVEKFRFYTEAIRLKPDYAAAFYHRGNARQDQGDLEGATAEYNEAIRLKPDYGNAFCGMYELTAEDLWNTYGTPEDVSMLEWLLEDIDDIEILFAPWDCDECGRYSLIFHALALKDGDTSNATGAMYWPGIIREIRAAAAASTMKLPMGAVKPRDNEVCQGCAWCDAPFSTLALNEDMGVLTVEGVLHDVKFKESGQRFRLRSWPPVGIDDLMERVREEEAEEDE